MEAKLFAPDFISTEMAEINAVFAPDFKSFYYSIRMPNGQLVLMETKFDGKQWLEPEVCSFSGEYADADPFFTYDGQWMYFISKRPIDSAKSPKKDWDIWRVSRENGIWSEPEWLGEEINSPQDDLYSSFTRDGTMYFSSSRLGRWRDIFCAKKKEMVSQHPSDFQIRLTNFGKATCLCHPIRITLFLHLMVGKKVAVCIFPSMKMECGKLHNIWAKKSISMVVSGVQF